MIYRLQIHAQALVQLPSTLLFQQMKQVLMLFRWLKRQPKFLYWKSWEDMQDG